MEFTSRHQPLAGPSTHTLSTWPSSNSSQGGKRVLSDGEGDGGESEEDDGKGGEAPKKRRRRWVITT